MICVQDVVSVLVTIGKNYLVDFKEKISLKSQPEEHEVSIEEREKIKSN